jgi:hypothetical protein
VKNASWKTLFWGAFSSVSTAIALLTPVDAHYQAWRIGGGIALMVGLLGFGWVARDDDKTSAQVGAGPKDPTA